MKLSKQEEVLLLIKHYLRVFEASKNPNSTDRFIKGQGLIAKCFEHCASTVYLLRGTILPEINISYKDFGTVFVTTRAALESLLTFGDIFYLPKSDEEFEFKHNCWLVSGLLDLEGLFPEKNLTEVNKETILGNKIKIKELKDKIKINPSFLKLTDKQKKKVLEGNWKSEGWVQMAVNIGLDKDRIDGIYSFLCAHAHSGGLSGNQYNHLVVSNEDPQIEEPIEFTISVILANMINMFCELNPNSKDEHALDPNGIVLVKACVDIGREPLEVFN